MDNSKPFISRLKCPTVTPNHLKQPTRILQPVVKNVPSHEEPVLKLPLARRMLTRRSKSFSDLSRVNKATTENKPALFLSKQPLNLKPKMLSTKANTVAINFQSRTAIKRPVPTATVTGGEPKPKVQKPMKPAPYDFKAKFTLLKEKYDNLVKDHTEIKKQYSEVNDELAIKTKFEEKYNELIQQSDRIQKQRDELNIEVIKLQTENKHLQIKSDELDFLRIDHHKLTLKYDNILNELDATKSERDRFQQDAYEFKTLFQKQEECRRSMHNKIQDLKGNIRVFCRIRPAIESEEFKILGNISCIDEETIAIQKTAQGRICDPRQDFTFDKVFSPDATQHSVFEELSFLIQSALDGYNVCVFAYGQTGSGKTHTMQGGNDKNSQGMIPRTVNLIFDLKKKFERIGWSYTVEVSVLEIYNETIKDLLVPNSQAQHEIRFNKGQGTTVTNLTIKQVKSPEEMHYHLITANKYRATATTNFNQHSSRSHAVTKITLTGKNEEMKLNYVGSVNLVDLAGSESAKNSERMTETKNINKSLSTLGTVMSALHSKSAHIPYRNSKLTYLLQSCLGGNSKTLMFVNIAPFEECYAESINALRFAGTVKEVKLGSKRNFK